MHMPERALKQPSAQLAYTLPTAMLSYSHFLDWSGNGAMEDMSGALKLVPALPRSPWPGRHRKAPDNYATSRARQINSLDDVIALIRKLSL